MGEGESNLIKNAGFFFFQNGIARKPATGPGKVLITLSRIKVHFLMFPFLFNNTLLSSLPNKMKMEALGSEGESRSKGLRINAFEAMGGLIPVTRISFFETFTGTETCYQSKRGVCGEPTFIFTHYLRGLLL